MPPIQDICTIGCSHLFGTHLEDCNDQQPSKLVWPSLIFGNRIINISKPGASCKTVSRRLIMYLATNSPCAVVIQWPNLLRWEVLDADFQYCGKDFPYQTNTELEYNIYNKKSSNKFKNIISCLEDSEVVRQNLETILLTNQILASKSIVCFNLYANDFPEINWPRHFYVKNINFELSPWEQFYQKYSNNLGYNSYHLNSTDIHVHNSNSFGDPYIQTLREQIKKYPTVDLEGLSWIDWCVKNQFDKKFQSSHYNEQAHQSAAEILKQKIII